MRRKTQKILFLLLLVLGVSVFLAACGRATVVSGCESSSGSYCLEVDRATGTYRHPLELSAGELLAINFETARGSLHLEIKAPDGTLLYSGNGEETTRFTVNIPETGTYSVSVEVRQAKGILHIHKTEKTQ